MSFIALVGLLLCVSLSGVAIATPGNGVATAEDSYSCPFSYTKLNHGCFKHYRIPETKTVAKSDCEAGNMNLIPHNTSSPYRGWVETEEAVNSTCQYYTGSGAAQERGCSDPAMYTCYIPAIKYSAPDDPHFDPDKKYQCNETRSETLYRDKCYSKRDTYRTVDEAKQDCSSGGYKLSATNITAAGYRNGWVTGTFKDGRLIDTDPSLTAPAMCGYVNKQGERLIGDCRTQLRALCHVPSSPCPADHVKCTDNTCVGVSVSDKMRWRDSAISIHLCGFGGSFLDTRKALEACASAVKTLTEANLWIGAALTERHVFQFNSGDEISLSTETQCLKITGDRLHLTSCTDYQHYLCEKSAEEVQKSAEEVQEGNDLVVVVLVVLLPVILGCLVLLLVYIKRGKQMCLSDSTAQELEGRGSGLTIENPVMSDLEKNEAEGSKGNTRQKKVT